MGTRSPIGMVGALPGVKGNISPNSEETSSYFLDGAQAMLSSCASAV